MVSRQQSSLKHDPNTFAMIRSVLHESKLVVLCMRKVAKLS
jgi:hypothetical protein